MPVEFEKSLSSSGYLCSVKNGTCITVNLDEVVGDVPHTIQFLHHLLTCDIYSMYVLWIAAGSARISSSSPLLESTSLLYDT